MTIRMVFHLPLRHTEGFLRSLADRLEVDLPIPYHRSIRELGRREWHTRSGYSNRSKYEKSDAGRATSRVQIACGVLDTMTRLGVPDSYRVT